MIISRRKFIYLAATSAALPHGSLRAAAQSQWPVRPITLTHGFAPGGGVDTAARLLAGGLSHRLGQQVVVEPKPGAGSTLAATQLARAPADGHTLSLFTSTYATAAAMYKSLPFRAIDDFSMISLVVTFPYVIATYAEHPVHNVAELIDTARRATKPPLYGTSGTGSVSHLLMELLGQSTNVNFQHVPFRGGAQALTELLAHRIDYMLDPPTILLDHVKSGKLRIIAVSTAARAPALPDVPTIAEAEPKLRDFDVVGWVGLGGPRGLPEAVVTKLNSETAVVLAESATAERLRAIGNEPSPSTPAALRERIVSEIDKWTSVIAKAGIERI
jgi:tripartite-type tricarboxylate transporter receptor subunit TctC